MDSASLNKLKVAELQQLLKDRGLGASGNKAELVQRLIKAQVTNETPATSTPSKDAEEPASGAAKSKDHAEPTAASASKDTDTAHATEEKAATKATLPPKKAAAKIDAAATENGKEHADVAEHEDTGVNVLDLGEEERRKLRAAKFGLPDEASEEERKKARAAKFGLPDEDADNEKRKARAAKFGITDDSASYSKDAERIKARMAKFGIAATAEPAESEDKVKARMERFKSGQTETAANGAAKKEKKGAVTGIEPCRIPIERGGNARQATPEDDEKLKKRLERFGAVPEPAPASAAAGGGKAGKKRGAAAAAAAPSAVSPAEAEKILAREKRFKAA